MRSDPDKRLHDKNAIRLKPHLDKDSTGEDGHSATHTLGDASSIPVNRVYVPEKFRLSITQRPAAMNRDMKSSRSRRSALLAKLALAVIAMTLVVYYLATTL